MASGTVYVDDVPFNYTITSGIAKVTYLNQKEYFDYEDAVANDKNPLPDKPEPETVLDMIPLGSLKGTAAREMLRQILAETKKATDLIKAAKK